MTVEAVVFDLGGVITEVTRDLYIAFAAESGIPVEALGPIFADGYAGLADMELGRTGFRAFLDQVCADLGERYGTTVDAQRLHEHVNESLTPTAEMIALIGEIRRSHRVGILTNNNPELRSVWEPRMPADLVDVIVDSSLIGMRKPDRGAYEFIVEKLGTTLARSVFVDDTPANVDAARDYGMPAVLFHDPEQCRRELVELGVRLGPVRG